MREPKAKKSLKPRKSSHILVTKKMLFGVRDELKSDITTLRLETKAAITDVKADVSKVLAAVHRVEVLVEEQNARNIFVLDGYTSLSDRVSQLEKKHDKDL
jgi:hypothetical protein